MPDADFTWPPELRPALALEALRNAIAQCMWDDEQRRAGLTSFPLHLATLHRDEYRAHADVVMRVVGPWVAAEVVAAEGRGRDAALAGATGALAGAEVPGVVADPLTSSGAQIGAQRLETK